MGGCGEGRGVMRRCILTRAERVDLFPNQILDPDWAGVEKGGDVACLANIERFNRRNARARAVAYSTALPDESIPFSSSNFKYGFFLLVNVILFTSDSIFFPN